MPIVYLLIAFIATTLGTLAGLGGGIVIRPALDALGDFDVFVIGVLSSATVLSMSMVSTIRRIISGVKIDKILVMLAVGGILGGYIGKLVFQFSLAHITPGQLTGVQAVVIIILLQITLFKNRLPRFQVDNLSLILLMGILLGGLASYLGIGGGPINVAVLCMFFAMDIKEAAAGSIFIILFSQAAKLVSIALTTGFGPYDYSILWYMIPAGVVGGVVGPMLKNKLTHHVIEIIFKVVVIFCVLLNVYNIIRLSA